MFTLHPLKQELNNELHHRQFPRIRGNVIISHVAITHNTNRDEQHQHLCQLLERFDQAPPATGASCHYADLGELDIRWEYHTEFSTYTIIRFNHSSSPFQKLPWAHLPDSWQQALPGDVLCALHLEVREHLEVEACREAFKYSHSLTASRIAHSAAELWSSQSPANDGFERLIMVRNGLNLEKTGRFIRCILELMGYRKMALLSAPTCRALLPQTRAMELELANITRQINQSSGANEKAILEQLSTLSSVLESAIANHQFRFDASIAYFDIVEQRIEELQESELCNHNPLSNFLQRRLIPARSTCQSLKQRMFSLSLRLDKASDLMRTRISLKLEEQNQALLKALNQRASAQFRMQQLVEAVSMVAVSYYLVQLVDYMLVLPPFVLKWVSKEELLAASVPIVFACVWLSFRRLRRFLCREQTNNDDR